MPRTLRYALSVLLPMLVLAGCASPTPYRPLTGGYGYSEQKIESNRYRVFFSGNSETPLTTIQNYLLYRAAQVTLAQGKDYFVIVDRVVQPEYSGDYGPEVGGFFGHGFGWGGSGFGFGTGVGFGTGGPILTDYSAYADIVLYSGPKPANNPRAYDAREVLSNLAPTIRRPGT